MITIDQLNESQRQAVKWTDGPLLVLAGPGSGKTAVLTMRIANLIMSSPEENFRILGLTFTVKAANEMQERINELLGETSRRIQLRTFHSFCTDLLRQHGSQLQLRPDFTVITDDKDRLAILKELDADDPEDALKKIDTLFTHGISAEDLPNHFDQNQKDQCRALQTMFTSYLQTLVKENQLDFGSMLHFTRTLLESKPRIARQVRTVYRYICVDEFQDTNLAQYKVLKLLTDSNNANLFVVADDDQVIFQWNGADPKRLEELKADYKPQLIQLPDNYRCPQNIVELANILISHNLDRFQEKTQGISQSKEKGEINVKSFQKFESELTGLAQELQKVSQNKREMCLVIARSNKLLIQVQEHLNSQGINAEIVSKHQDFSSPLMLTMYYCLKLANAPDSRSILNKLCSAATATDGITFSAEDISAKAQVEGLSLLRSFFVVATESESLRPVCDVGIANLCDTLQFNVFVDKAFKHFDGLNSGEHGESFPDYETDKENWNRIFTSIERNYGDALSLHTLLQEMDLTPKSKTLGRDCVRLQTVHTAKGMEFENVYLIGMAEDQFPTYFAIKQGKKSIEEELRNCFVAITRASKRLYISYAKEYFGYKKEPSRFLKQMGLLNE